jgi:flagellar motor switch protein FliN
MQPREHDLSTSLANELGAVVGALLQTSGRAAASGQGLLPRWIVVYDITGAYAARLVTAFDDTEARKLSRLINGLGANPTDAIVTDTLLEIGRQVAGSLTQLPVGAGTTMTVAMASTVPAGPPTMFDLVPGQAFSPRVACWAETGKQAAASTAAEHTSGDTPNLDVILDIELPLSVRFGSTEMTLKALTRLGLGSVIDLGRSPDDPVELLINDKIVARGDVVVVAGNYGVRITEVISAADRIRTLAP